MEYLPIIIILVLILIIIILIYTGVRRLQQKVRSISTTLFGTPNISEGAEKLRVELATTPKSVSAMTSLLLPKIAEDFPEFQYDEMKERANNVLISYLRGIDNRQVSSLSGGNMELEEQLRNHIEMLSSKGQQEHYEQIKIHRTEIHQYRKTSGRCIITFQSALECYHYVTDENGNVIDGSKDYKYQTKYNTDLIYIQNRDLVEKETESALGLTCPNCGAPIKILGSKFCEYCGSGIVELNIHAWSFSNIEEKN